MSRFANANATATTPVGEFERGPVFRVELDGTYPNPASKGRAKVTGSVEITFQGNGNAYVGTNGAHINDNNPGIEYRGKRFLASINAARQEDGTWTAERRVHVSDRDSWSIDNPAKTFVEAIRDALVHEVEKAWTPELERQATRASLLRELYHADREEREAREAHNKAAAAQQAIRDQLAALDAS